MNVDMHMYMVHTRVCVHVYVHTPTLVCVGGIIDSGCQDEKGAWAGMLGLVSKVCHGQKNEQREKVHLGQDFSSQIILFVFPRRSISGPVGRKGEGRCQGTEPRSFLASLELLKAQICEYRAFINCIFILPATFVLKLLQCREVGCRNFADFFLLACHLWNCPWQLSEIASFSVP